MESARAGRPRPSRRPLLTAVIEADGTDVAAVELALRALTAGIVHLDDIEVALILTGDIDDAAADAHEIAIASCTTGAYQVLRIPGADTAAMVRRGAGISRGRVVTYLGIHDEVSDGYLDALATSIVPNTIGVAAAPDCAPSWTGPQPIHSGITAWPRIGGKVFPVAAVRDIPAPEGLEPDATGAILLARIAGSYRYQHLTLSGAPANAGAIHHGHPSVVAPAESAFSGLVGLHHSGSSADARSSEALYRCWLDQLRQSVKDGNANPLVLRQELAARGVDIPPEDLHVSQPSPLLREYFADAGSKDHTVAIVMTDVSKTIGFSSALRGLRWCGSTVVVVHSTGEARSTLSSYARVVDIGVDTAAAAGALAAADDIIAVDSQAARCARDLAPERVVTEKVESVHALLLERAARSRNHTRLTVRAVLKAADRLVTNQPVAERLDPWTWPILAMRISLSPRTDALDDLVIASAPYLPDGSHPAAVMSAMAALNDVEGQSADRLREIADELFCRADEADDTEQTRVARLLQYLGMSLLFEPSQHTSVPTTPLVDRPDEYLAAMRGSRLHRRLTDADGPLVAPVRSAHTDRAVLLGGAFPKFAGVLLEALSTDRAVDRVDLSGFEARFRNVTMDPVTFRLLADVADHRPSHLLDRAVTAQIAAADIVVADWADKGLALASRVVPDGTRLVARVHGVDTLSPWAHLTRWDRVDCVIAPSDHLARALRATVGPAMDGVPVHVVPNPVETQLFTTVKTPAARRTLGLIGWSQRVKDAIFPLEVLALLRADDPRWRLRLVGNDFLSSARPVEHTASQAFRERSTRKDVAGGLDFVPFTADITSVMSEIGWAMSTSRRESFHLGLFEMAASGAVPVVRDWPVYAGGGGAKTLVPPDWVVDSPRAAADRILDVDDTWDDERLAARDHVVTHYDHPLVVEQLRGLLGPQPAREDTARLHGSTPS